MRLRPSYTRTFDPTKTYEKTSLFSNSSNKRILISKEGHMRDGCYKNLGDLGEFLMQRGTKCLTCQNVFATFSIENCFQTLETPTKDS